jgi:hypothetical protein
MDSNFKLGSKVLLKTFHNTINPPVGTSDSENYWKLIGLTGHIVSDVRKIHPAFLKMGERVLVKFDNDISTYGVQCHNEQATNALWLFLTDLVTVEV